MKNSVGQNLREAAKTRFHHLYHCFFKSGSEKQEKFRHEYKYLATPQMIEILSARISPVCQLDTHAGDDGLYTISSLYFDTYENSSWDDNEFGVGKRSKYRIRIYNHDTSVIRLEKKHKDNTMTLKTSCALTLEQCQALVNREELAYQEDFPPLLKDFYHRIHTQGMHPSAIIQYERKAFVDSNGNVRITFDKNISASTQTELFLSEDALFLPFHPPYSHLMEVKYDEFIPHYIRQSLQSDLLSHTTFSKYYLGKVCLSSFGKE